MRIGGRRVPGCIRYPGRVKRLHSLSLEDSLRRILTLERPSASLGLSSSAIPRRRACIRTYHQWMRLRRSRAFENRSVSTYHLTRIRELSLLRHDRRSDENSITEEIQTQSFINFGESVGNSGQIDFRSRSIGEHIDRTMSSQNDSIIWNNRSSDQLESNLSLVANPPSSISQHEDSIVSEDSQYTRSSQLDLALEDERRWMKYRIENLTRDECIITCVLAQVCADIMMLSCDELPGSRDTIPSDEEAKQSLLYLSYGGCWELNNLRTVLDLAEFLPVGLRRLCGLGVRDRGSSSRKVLEGRLEQCLDLTRRLNLQQTG